MAKDDLDTTDVVDEIEGEGEGEGNGDGEGKLILGRFKTSDDLAKAYQNLERDYSKKGNELSQMKAQMSKKETPSEPEDPEAQFNKTVAEIQQQMEDGTISVAEGTVKIASLSANLGQHRSLQAIEKRNAETTLAKSQSAFLEKHPEFNEMKQSGELEKIKASLPGLHDDFSAFYAYLAEKNAAAVEAAREEGINLGKDEAARIESGNRNVRKIGTQTGSHQALDDDGKPINVKGLSDRDRKQRMMSALRKREE